MDERVPPQRGGMGNDAAAGLPTRWAPERGPDGGPPDGIDLYWLPLGAGGHVVRWNGRLYEAVRARRQRRDPTDLYHSALVVHLPPDRWVVEMTPLGPAVGRAGRGVVAEGAVGTHSLGRWRLFRYEVHCWRDGAIVDVAEAVGGPVRLTSDAQACRRLLAVLPSLPTPVWGRDELGAGDMWNSNSVTSWALASAGLDAGAIRPPARGRAPGWAAGVQVSGRCAEPLGTSGRLPP